MRSAANGHVEMAKVSCRVADTSVRGSKSFHAETKSKSACLHTEHTGRQMEANTQSGSLKHCLHTYGAKREK